MRREPRRCIQRLSPIARKADPSRCIGAPTHLRRTEYRIVSRSITSVLAPLLLPKARGVFALRAKSNSSVAIASRAYAQRHAIAIDTIPAYSDGQDPHDSTSALPRDLSSHRLLVFTTPSARRTTNSVVDCSICLSSPMVPRLRCRAACASNCTNCTTSPDKDDLNNEAGR